jgi:hypothetical protein
MIHAADTYRRGIVGTLAMLLVCATSASAQQLKLSDEITLQNGNCLLRSVADDKEAPPEVLGPQKCAFKISPNGFIQVAVPGNKDEIIVCSCTIAANGTISGPGRENQGPGAYSVTIRGKTKPGTTPVTLLKVGATIQVWEDSKAR